MSNRYVESRKADDSFDFCFSVSDYQRKKVYEAENIWLTNMWNEIESTKTKLPNGRTCSPDADHSSIFYMFPSIEAVKSYLEFICDQEWMEEEFGSEINSKLRNTNVFVRNGNRYSHAKFGNLFLAPKWGFRKDVVLHEFAHVVTHYLNGIDGGHGRLFARTHLTLIKNAVGSDAWSELIYAYDKAGVKYTGDDSIFAKQRIEKQRKDIAQGLVVIVHEPRSNTFSIHRLLSQKIQNKYVPSMEWNGYGRWIAWTNDVYCVNGQNIKIFWETRWGRYAYFAIAEDNGSIQWYKFRMEGNNFHFNPCNEKDKFLFTPAFAQTHSENELIEIAKTLLESN